MVLETRSGRCYSLNDCGALIWEAICEQNDVEQIISRVTGTFDAPADRVSSDVNRLLESFLAFGLLEEECTARTTGGADRHVGP